MPKKLFNGLRGFRKVLLGALCAVIFFVVAINFVKNWRVNHQIDSEIINMQQQVNSLEQENLQFRQLIDYFNSSAYVEERARVDLGLKKPGEKVIVVPDNDFTTSTPELSDETANKSNFKKWLDYLFN